MPPLVKIVRRKAHRPADYKDGIKKWHQSSKILDIIEVNLRICYYCHPDHESQVHKLTQHLFEEENPNLYKGGFTKEKAQEYGMIKKEYEKNKLVPCINLDQEFGFFICKQCLLKVTERM